MKALLGVLIVSACYVIAGVLLYRLRRSSGGALDSDLLVFYLPALIALYANSRIVKHGLPAGWGQAKRRAVRWGIAVAVTFVAMWVFMVIAFNTYGT